MGESTNLYLSPRWSLEDIVKVIESQFGTKVDAQPTNKISLDMFHFCFKPKDSEGRVMTVFVNSPMPLGGMTCLSMYRCELNSKIMISIAKVLGGLYIDNDCDDKGELISGMFDEETQLPYFYKYAAIRNKLKDDKDLVGLNECIHEWHDEISDTDRNVMNLFPRKKK